MVWTCPAIVVLRRFSLLVAGSFSLLQPLTVADPSRPIENFLDFILKLVFPAHDEDRFSTRGLSMKTDSSRILEKVPVQIRIDAGNDPRRLPQLAEALDYLR